MSIQNFENLAAANTPNRAFVAWERRTGDPNVDGIYFLNIDKNTQINDPENILNTGIKIVPSSTYGNKDIEFLSVYANNDGSDVSISFVVPTGTGNTREMYTGRVVGNQYLACDGGNTRQYDSGIRRLFGVYLSNNSKIKIVETTGGVGSAEGH